MTNENSATLFLATILSLSTAVGVKPIHAVTCGTTGATLKIVVQNPNPGSSISATVSGDDVAGVTTCTDANATYSVGTGSFSTATKEVFVADLNCGLWVHKISVSSGSNVYDQYQKGMVLKADSDPNDPNAPADPARPFSEVKWTYYANSIKVNVAGDTPTGTCTTSCTFRQAVTTVNTLSTSTTNRALIFFTTSPGTMTQASAISLTKSYVTIDGTDANGNPWIVGDTLGSQDSISRIIDFANVAYLNISSSADSTIVKGLELKNTVASGSSRTALIDDAGSETRIDSVRIDGGAGSDGSSNGALALIRIAGDDTATVNVEARHAKEVAIRGFGGKPNIADSWIHNNVAGGIEAVELDLASSLIELSGGTGVGASGQDLGILTTDANLIRNNSIWGARVLAVASSVSFNNDYVCGNGSSGTRVQLFNSGTDAFLTGVAAVYNELYGVEMTGNSGGEGHFDDDNALTANDDPGLRNGSTGTISAENNQWRDLSGTSCLGSADISGSNVDCNPSQDWEDVDIVLDVTTPVYPTNVVRVGQAIRVKGIGFNAIDGNPLPDPNNPMLDCTIGASDAEDNCCRLTTKANTCEDPDPNDPYNALEGKTGEGNCVAISDRQGLWHAAEPSGVTPTTITLGLPGNIPCIGEHDELVRVSKIDGSMDEAADDAPYCTNREPK